MNTSPFNFLLGKLRFPAAAMLVTRIVPYRRPMIMAVHALLVASAYLSAFLIRFEFNLPAREFELFLRTLPLLLVVRLLVFACFHLHEGLWRYVSMRDIVAILKAGTLGSLIFTAGVLLLFGHGFPRSVLVLDWILCLALVGGVRLGLRAVRESRLRVLGSDLGIRDLILLNSQRRSPTRESRTPRRVLIVGAGDAGEMLIREIERSWRLDYNVIGFIDDDPRKHHSRIHGVEVIGGVEEIPHLCHDRNIEEVLIAIPSATPEERRRVYRYCLQSGVPFKTIPPLSDLLQGKARISQLEEVKPEDLLGRSALRLDTNKLRGELQGKRILVTGAGGSIGSELCRQLAAFEPELILMLDRAESSLYFADVELKRLHPSLRVVPVVGDILDRPKVEEIMSTYAPELIYHAAAYKHVPLMEEHPLEAIKNNIFGTETLALAAQKARVGKFVFISTDKAVKPVGIMGMTKRVAECLLQYLSRESGAESGDSSAPRDQVSPSRTVFVAVRFGNVLGSDGSVLPLFRWQIERGGPLTITDPEATRYFMLMSEAAQLVLQAAVIGRGGEIFFLDMGEPVRILDLAKNLVRLSGLEPGRDIEIQVTGLRPGERLREELVMESEHLLPSEHEKVFIVENGSFDRERFRRDLETLRGLVAARERERAVEELKAMAARY